MAGGYGIHAAKRQRWPSPWGRGDGSWRQSAEAKDWSWAAHDEWAWRAGSQGYVSDSWKDSRWGQSSWGDCWSWTSKDWDVGCKKWERRGQPQPRGLEARAGLRFIVESQAHELAGWQPHRPWQPLDTGPARIRIIGSVEALGWEGVAEPQYGVDLFWEGDRWTSVVLDVHPKCAISFRAVQVQQSQSHPGLLQGAQRERMHRSRRFLWGAQHQIWAPEEDQVAEIVLVDLLRSSAAPLTRVLPRAEFVAPALALDRWTRATGRQLCHTFDGPGGVSLNFSLYLPAAFQSSDRDRWPLLLFLHAMHSRLDGDNNLFYESDTPLRLLLGDPKCPQALLDSFIVLSPQCPPDPEWPQDVGVWLRRGGVYETSVYNPEVEVALGALLEAVVERCGIDRQRISVTGTSMGAYATLELAARWPGCFAAAAPVAAHYDLDPIDPLVERLAEQAIPLWFFHARNDFVCPFADVESLVERLRARSRAKVWLTSYEDTWSSQGHCADRVAYWAKPAPGTDHEAYGEELFEWLARPFGRSA